MIDANLFSEKLKEARKTAGLTQKELADEMGISQQAYFRYESCKVQMNYEILYFICTRLGISADDLLGIAND